MNPSLLPLQPGIVGEISEDPERDLADFEISIGARLPDALRQHLIEFGAAVRFSAGAMFKPRQRTFIEDEAGLHRFEVLFGLAHDRNGIREKNETYADQLPPGYIAIGGSSGGDLICLARSSGKIMYWNHEAESEETSLFEIAPTFIDFVSSLLVDDAIPDRSRKVVSTGRLLKKYRGGSTQ